MDQTPVPIAGTATTTAESVEVTNPFTGDVIARVPLCEAGEVDRACRHATEVLRADAFPQHERVAVLERASRLLLERHRGPRPHARRGGRQATAHRTW